MRYYRVLALFFSAAAILIPYTVSAASLTTRLEGQFLIQVQNHGELWYVSPIDHKRHLVGSGNALNWFIETNGQIGFDPAQFPLAGSDKAGTHIAASKEAIAAAGGHIIASIFGINTSGVPSVWYISPKGIRYPVETIKDIAVTAIGITNRDLLKIPAVVTTKKSEKGKIIDCGDSMECMIKAAETCSPARSTYQRFSLSHTAYVTDEIIGAGKSGCLEKRTTSGTFMYMPDGIPKSITDAYKPFVSGIQLKKSLNITCTGPNKNTATYFSKIEQGLDIAQPEITCVVNK